MTRCSPIWSTRCSVSVPTVELCIGGRVPFGPPCATVGGDIARTEAANAAARTLFLPNMFDRLHGDVGFPRVLTRARDAQVPVSRLGDTVDDRDVFGVPERQDQPTAELSLR